MTQSPGKRLLRCRSARADASRTGWLVPVALAAFAVLAAAAPTLHALAAWQEPSPSAPAGEVYPLAPGDVVRRRMKAGANHVFELKLAPQQFAQIVVAQQGVDVGVKVSAPDRSLLIDMDSPNGLYGIETASIAASVAGSYLIQLYSEKTMPPGDYELTVKGPRELAPPDLMRVNAERAYYEAQTLRSAAGNAQTTREESAKKYDAAVRKYEEARGIWRELGDLRGEGYALFYTGRVYRAQRRLAQALDYLEQARERLHAADDVSGQAFVLNETGAAHRELGDLFKALSSYRLALELRNDIKDLWGQAQLYNNIGLTYAYIGYQPKALQNFEKALPIWRAFGLRRSEMNTLVNAAKSSAEMGEIGTAFQRYDEVLRFCDTEDKGTHLKPVALNGLGLVYDTWADPDAARGYYKQAVELFRAQNNERGEADTLDNLGMMYAFLGDSPQALEQFRQALAIRERLNEPKGWGVTLSNLGYALTLLGDNEEALGQLAAALQHNESARDRRFEAYTLQRMGMAYISLGEPRKALERYERAFAIQQEPDFADRRGQAITLDKMGEALALSGEQRLALTTYGQALERWKAVGDGQGQALTLYGMARVEYDSGNLAHARDMVEEAIQIVELLRNRVNGRQLRMIYFTGKQDFYALAIEVRMRLYEKTNSAADMEAALSASERARARNLIDLLSEARAEPHKGMSAQDTEKHYRLEREISELTQTLVRLRSLGEKESVEIVEAKLAARGREQDELLAPVRRAGALAAGVSHTRPLAPREIQQLLDDDTLLLQYSLGEVRSHLWTVTANGIEHHYLAGRARIEQAAEQFRLALTAYEPQKSDESAAEYLNRWRQAPGQYQRSALELSRLALGSVWPQLGDKRLVVVADGALHYVPFEALLVPVSAAAAPPAAGTEATRELLTRNEVVYQPSASTLSLLRGARRSNAYKAVAVLADPVFDDKDKRVRAPGGRRRGKAPSREAARARLNRALRDIGDDDFALAKLEYSRREANAITAVAPRGSWLKAVDFRASRATATDPALRRFGIIHFATHGILNDKHPDLSGIVLSMVNERGGPEDGYLSLRDVYNLDLPVQLVVLSACRTGVGKQVRGEGLVGLTRGFMYAGAPRVVASLWRVDDEATAELMKLFYRHMLGKEKMPAAAALRRAKLEMMEGRQLWGAPYYWAGFVLQGDWK